MHSDIAIVNYDTVNSNSNVLNTDSDTPIINSDTPSLHIQNLDSDEVREKYDTTV